MLEHPFKGLRAADFLALSNQVGMGYCGYRQQVGNRLSRDGLTLSGNWF